MFTVVTGDQKGALWRALCSYTLTPIGRCRDCWLLCAPAPAALAPAPAATPAAPPKGPDFFKFSINQIKTKTTSKFQLKQHIIKR